MLNGYISYLKKRKRGIPTNMPTIQPNQPINQSTNHLISPTSAMSTTDSTKPKYSDNKKHFLITIDVEDWFQVENFKSWVPFETWSKRELRVENNVHRLLDLFDSIRLEPLQVPNCRQRVESDVSMPSHRSDAARTPLNEAPPITDTQESRKVHTTFFVLGWIAEKLPRLVREIADRGHEVASHGYLHKRCSQLFGSELKTDLIKSKNLLEDIIGTPVTGYRAPSFDIKDNILSAIAESGYTYDSSYNSFKMHKRYGRIKLNDYERNGIAYKLTENFYEIPVSNLKINTIMRRNRNRLGMIQNGHKHLVVPLGGGGYFRLLPYPFFKFGVNQILKYENAYIFYMHPWEIDPGQPKIKEASLTYRFRHYNNIGSTYTKLKKLLNDFSNCCFCNCMKFLETIK